jgi:hypothetical protein
MKKLLIILLIVSLNTYALSPTEAAKTVIKITSSFIPHTDGKRTIAEMYSVENIVFHKLVFNFLDKDFKNNYKKLYGVKDSKLIIEMHSKAHGMISAAEMCFSDGPFMEALKSGVYMIYKYYDSDGNYIYKYGFDESVCEDLGKDYRSLLKKLGKNHDPIWESE